MEKRVKQSKKNLSTEMSEWQFRLINCLIGSGIGLGVALVFCLLVPFVLLKTQNPNGMLIAMAAICGGMGGIGGGIFTGLKCKGQALVCSLITSGFMILVMMLVSFIIGKGFNLLGFAVIVVSLIGAALLGAFITTKILTSKKRSFKRIKRKR